MKDNESPPAVEVNDLWFSYEVAENTSATAKVLDKSERTQDGGLSISNPRKQYDGEVVYKLQLAGVEMMLPAGSRCLLIGANGAGKSTLMNVIGGKHLVEPGTVKVLGREAFHDTNLSSDVALLTGNWTHTVSFVGHNVPYQAMEVSRLIASHSINVDPERVTRLVQLLEVDEKWNLTTVSDGQRRRVQILCKLLQPRSVLLLDEITTDLDLLARHDLLSFLREESTQRGVSILYCTHIFDGLDGWATHLAYVVKGKMRFCKPLDALDDLLAVPASARSRGWGALFCAVQRALLEQWPSFRELLQLAPTGTPAPPPPGAAVCVRGLVWGYAAARTPQLRGLSFEVPRGCRCLLVGANGAGKTTLLRLIGGKHMIAPGAIEVLGHHAFHDLCLNTMVSLLSGDWTRSVACVGNGVPFQADFSVEYMATAFMEALVRDGMSRELIAARMDRLVTLLDMDLSWRLHQVSDGQRRRAQLLLKLLRPSDLLLMDEVTTDLDVVSRQALLHFLREECEQRGATVIYSTHIFDGLDDWPTHMLHLKHGTVAYSGPIETMPKAPAGATPVCSESGSLFNTVRGWLLAEREEGDPNAKQSHIDATANAPPPEPAPKPATAASKFDRFGGGSRQSMYR
ncbi:hypothetical protein AB1Y20_015879 [Prymnesium parvum]|uniref:ABC transporter domain-containing protein n=1 Tax=Prymnesium parvum TaxID=97485 RepID=A0AB34K2M8_PRYPA